MRGRVIAALRKESVSAESNVYGVSDDAETKNGGVTVQLFWLPAVPYLS